MDGNGDENDRSSKGKELSKNGNDGPLCLVNSYKEVITRIALHLYV